MTNNTHENKLKYDLSLVGIGELMKAPIKATLSSLDFPNITLELQQNNDGTPFYNGTLTKVTQKGQSYPTRKNSND